MDKVNYIIFEDMRGALAIISDKLKKQSAINKRFALFSVATMLLVVAVEKTIRGQNERIEELTKEVEELKQTRGE